MENDRKGQKLSANSANKSVTQTATKTRRYRMNIILKLKKEKTFFVSQVKGLIINFKS